MRVILRDRDFWLGATAMALFCAGMAVPEAEGAEPYVAIGPTGFMPSNTNQDDIEARSTIQPGAEIGVGARLTPWFTADARFNWRQVDIHGYGEQSADGDWNTVSLTLGGRYSPWYLDFGARLTVAQAGAYSVPVASGAVGPADAWTTVDLYASWKPQEGFMRGFEVIGGVDNLLNADYRPNLAIDRSRGRTFKITLAKAFGY